MKYNTFTCTEVQKMKLPDGLPVNYAWTFLLDFGKFQTYPRINTKLPRTGNIIETCGCATKEIANIEREKLLDTQPWTNNIVVISRNDNIGYNYIPSEIDTIFKNVNNAVAYIRAQKHSWNGERCEIVLKYDRTFETNRLCCTQSFGNGEFSLKFYKLH